MSNHTTRFAPRRPVVPCTKLFVHREGTPKPEFVGILNSVHGRQANVTMVFYEIMTDALGALSQPTFNGVMSVIVRRGHEANVPSEQFIDKLLIPGDIFLVTGRYRQTWVRKIVDSEQCACRHEDRGTLHFHSGTGNHYCLACGLEYPWVEALPQTDLPFTCKQHRYGWSDGRYVCMEPGCGHTVSSVELIQIMRKPVVTTPDERKVTKCNNHVYELNGGNYTCHACNHTMSPQAAASLPKAGDIVSKVDLAGLFEQAIADFEAAREQEAEARRRQNAKTVAAANERNRPLPKRDAVQKLTTAATTVTEVAPVKVNVKIHEEKRNLDI